MLRYQRSLCTASRWLSMRSLGNHTRRLMSTNLKRVTTPSISRFVAEDTGGNGFVPLQQNKGLTLGILRETYDSWERRVPLCPHHVQQLLQNQPSFPRVDNVMVQPSPQRCFYDHEYQKAGAVVREDISQADIILGVKRPKREDLLLRDKTYVFFSHVIKGQPENMALLKSVLERKVRLIDYECIVEEKEVGGETVKNRVVAFGKYAGLAGMIDSFYPLGRRLQSSQLSIHTPFLHCPPSNMHRDLEAAKRCIEQMGQEILSEGFPPQLEPLVFCVTGKGGKVHGGAMEILELLPKEVVSAKDLPEVSRLEGKQNKIYICTPEPEDLYQNRHCDEKAFDRMDWRQNPSDYRSLFATTIAPYIHVLVNCIYWDARYARLLTKDDAQRLYEQGKNRLLVVSDISCDVKGSIGFLDRTCTIAKPFFQYDPIARQEVAAEIGEDGITVMGVDILPAELPRDSSFHFGDSILKVFENVGSLESTPSSNQPDALTSSPLLANACITTPEGVLSPRFRYLDSFLQLPVSKDGIADQSMDLLLRGHLFDTGFINSVLDVVETHHCWFKFLNCRVNRAGDSKDVERSEKSTALLRISGDKNADMDSLEAKIHLLSKVIERADATTKRIDRCGSLQSKSYTTDDARQSSASVESSDEQRVLVLGAGRVSMSVVDLLGRSEGMKIEVASDKESEARAVAAFAKHGRHKVLDLGNDTDGLAGLIEGKDLVISLLPAPFHPRIAQECILQRVNLVTASYESDAMRKMNDRAQEAGVVILNEVGLDPGLDHMSAMRMIDDIRSRGGKVTSFKSVCGGLPSPEAASNPLQYKFSWSPKGVISACQNDAKYRWDGKVVEVFGKELMGSVMPFTDAWNDISLECLPNRDSLRYESIYGIENAKTVFRGTLRFSGFSSLMNVFQNMGLFEATPCDAISWDGAMNMLRMNRGGFDSMEDFLSACADEHVDEAARALETLEWLGMVNGLDFGNNTNIVDAFCDVLERQLKFEEGERDMVVMHHEIEASFEGNRKEIHHSSLRVFGDAAGMSAMCKTVGFTTAAAADLILRGDLKDRKGLVLPIDPQIYRPTLQAVDQEGISFTESVVDDDDKP